MSLFSSLCLVAAIALNTVAAVQCDFMNLILTYNYDNAEPDTFELHFGFWNYKAWTQMGSSGSIVYEGCRMYPDYISVGSQWKLARTFSILALLFGVGMGALQLFTTMHSDVRKRLSPAVCIGYFVCSLCSGLSLLILGSDLCKDNELTDELESILSIPMDVARCGLARGSKCAISATVLWFVAGAANFVATSKARVGDDNDENGNNNKSNVGDSPNPAEEPLLQDDA